MAGGAPQEMSKQEHLELYDLHSDGLTIEEIAKEMNRTPSAISNRLNLIYWEYCDQAADFAEEISSAKRDNDVGRVKLGVSKEDSSVSRFVIENEFFRHVFANDKGETGVCIESKLGTSGFGSMTFEAFRSWQDIVNLSQSWLSMQEAKGEIVMLSEHFASDDDGLFRCTLLLS